jgi:hypothetical protein
MLRRGARQAEVFLLDPALYAPPWFRGPVVRGEEYPKKESAYWYFLGEESLK